MEDHYLDLIQIGSEVQRGLQSIVQRVQVASDILNHILNQLSSQYNTRVVKGKIRCYKCSIDL